MRNVNFPAKFIVKISNEKRGNGVSHNFIVLKETNVMEIINWDKGDILRGREGTDARHPIVFLEGRDDTYFIGAMITSSSKYKDNIPMLKEHFEKYNRVGKRHDLYFKNSYLVEAKLLKRLEWKPFRKVGRLTNKGITFVESTMREKYPMVWEEYLN
ncbi:MAG: hypothetical protein BMS9Abin13_415 [Patescibacteria group bacterium]|nr:MAG: hypothetical protein BMS9Abin13_415 [Patescibacteria group bacterium]